MAQSTMEKLDHEAKLMQQKMNLRLVALDAAGKLPSSTNTEALVANARDVEKFLLESFNEAVEAGKQAVNGPTVLRAPLNYDARK